MNIRNIQVGDLVTFKSGNFADLTGKVTKVNWDSANSQAIYGFYHEVQLSDGRTVYIEKGEHVGQIAKPVDAKRTIDRNP